MATNDAPQSWGTWIWNTTLYTIEVVTWPVTRFFGFHHHNILALTTPSVPSRPAETARVTCSNAIPEDSLALPYSEEEPSTSVPFKSFEENMENPKDNASTSGGAAGGTDLIDIKRRVSYNSQTIKPARMEVNKKSSIRNDAAQSSSGKSPSLASGATNPKLEEARAMAALRDVVSLYEQLKLEWIKKPKNLEKCRELLDRLKVGLTSLMFLPTSNKTASQDELLIARDILEIGAQWSIEVKDIPSFERYMAQLKCYYLDYRDHLAESAYKYQLLGLNLLFLLSQNRVAEFHTELELLPSDQIQSNVYIRHPLSLEQYLMEGSYNKIFLAKGNVPADSYNFFMDILLDTIRNEIAACLEKAYEKISLKEATRMLNLPNQQAIKEYGAKKKWVLGPDNYYYFNTVEAKTENILASTELAEQAIDYARELEMIV